MWNMRIIITCIAFMSLLFGQADFMRGCGTIEWDADWLTWRFCQFMTIICSGIVNAGCN